MTAFNRDGLRSAVQRIGEAKILEMYRVFYREMSEDLLIGFFFDGKNLESIAQAQNAFFLRATGLRDTYTGKAPSTAHLGLAPILWGHFDRRLRILEKVLVRFGITPAEVRDWIAFENLFRAAIVADEGPAPSQESNS